MRTKTTESTKLQSGFIIDADEVKAATIRFINEGSKASVGNRKGIAGIGILTNRYYRAKVNAIAILKKYDIY